MSRDLRFGNTLVRPFVEAQAGLESYARLGFDAVFGKNLSQNFFVRDPVTGHLLTNVRHSDQRSFGFMMGGDVAYVGGQQSVARKPGLYGEKAASTGAGGFCL